MARSDQLRMGWAMSGSEDVGNPQAANSWRRHRAGRRTTREAQQGTRYLYERPLGLRPGHLPLPVTLARSMGQARMSGTNDSLTNGGCEVATVWPPPYMSWC
jgi:hypothetical protein